MCQLLGEVNVGLTTIPVAPYMTWGDSGKTVPTKGVGAGNQKIAPKFEGQDSTDDEEEEFQVLGIHCSCALCLTGLFSFLIYLPPARSLSLFGFVRAEVLSRGVGVADTGLSAVHNGVGQRDGRRRVPRIHFRKEGQKELQQSAAQ